MKQLSSLRPRLRARAGLVLAAAAIYAASVALSPGADSNPGKDAQAQSKAENNKSEKKIEKKADKKAEKKKLTGAELYAINCNRCHNERYPTEFTAAQWKTIMLQMQVRANLPADQAKAILKYLQEDSGTP